MGNIIWIRQLTRFLFAYKNSILEQNITGINFSNPIGLAAGFDKNGQLTKIIPEVEFGYMEIGSVTGNPCLGNPKPRLFRSVKSKSLIVNYDLVNDGCEIISQRLQKKPNPIFPIGISIDI